MSNAYHTSPQSSSYYSTLNSSKSSTGSTSERRSTTPTFNRQTQTAQSRVKPLKEKKGKDNSHALDNRINTIMNKSIPVYQPPAIAAEETMVVPVPSDVSELQSELVEKSKEILNLKDIIRIYESRHINVEENEKEHIKSKASIKIMNTELMNRVEELENELSYKDKIIQNDKLVIDDLNKSLNRLVDEVQRSKNTESSITEQFNTLYQEMSQLDVVSKEYLNQISKLNKIIEDKDKRLEELSNIIDKNMEVTSTLKEDNDSLKAANQQLQIEINECQNKENKELENLELLNQQLKQKMNEIIEENNLMKDEILRLTQLQPQQEIVNPTSLNEYNSFSASSTPLQQQQQPLQYQRQNQLEQNLMNETIDQSIYELLLSSLDILCKYTNTPFCETPLTVPIINNTLVQICNVVKQRINTEKSLLMDGSDTEIAALNIKIAYEIKIHEFVKQMADLEGTIVELRTSQMNLLTELASYKEKEKLGLLSQTSISDGINTSTNNNNNNNIINDEKIKELNDSVSQLQERLKSKEMEVEQLSEKLNNSITSNNRDNDKESYEMNELRNKLTTTQAELDRNKSMITSIQDQYNQQIKEKDEEIERLNGEINNLRNDNSESFELNDRINEKDQIIERLNNELNQLKSDNNELSELKEKIEKLVEEISKKDNEITSKDQQIDKLRTDLQESQELQQSMSSGSNEAMNTLQEQLKNKNNEIDNKNNEIQNMNNEIESKNNEIETLNQTIQQLQQQNKEKDNQITTQKAETDVLIDNYKKAEDSLNKSNTEIERLKKIINDKNDIIKSKDNELSSFEKVVGDLKNNIKEKETIIEVENSAHADNMKKLELQLSQLEEAIKSNESDNLLTILQQCQETITTTSGELEKSKEIINKYKEENEQLINEKKELENQINEFRNTPDNASAIIERLTKQNEEKDKQIEQLSKENIPSPGFINECKLYDRLQEKYNNINELVKDNEAVVELVKDIPTTLEQIHINLQSQKDKVSEEIVSYQSHVEDVNNTLSSTIESVNASNCEKHDEIVSILHDMKAETEPDLTYLSNIINELQSIKLE